VREFAPAKVNLCLCVGGRRSDGLHELVSLMQSVTLCDELEISDGDRDEVLCPGVDGPNLVSAALTAFRERTGWDGPGQRVTVVKRIPVAAGMGGGSADAAAALRLLARRSGLGTPLLGALAAGLGSDVPSQLRPGRAIVRGAGETVAALPDPGGFGVLVLPSRASLATAAVYHEFDRLEAARPDGELAALDPHAMVGVNDLEAAALRLEPSIADALALVRQSGASVAMVCGSGPTVIGLFGDHPSAARAALELRAGGLDARAARPYPGSASVLV
jgi:4-diphosphocytidyl-2-C-methyl-D-erythritol kinase